MSADYRGIGKIRTARSVVLTTAAVKTNIFNEHYTCMCLTLILNMVDKKISKPTNLKHQVKDINYV